MLSVRKTIECWQIKRPTLFCQGHCGIYIKCAVSLILEVSREG